MIDEAEIKKALMRLIGDVLDETSLPDRDSFVEMEGDVIHCAVEEDLYYQVVLSRVSEDQYGRRYIP